MIRKLLKFFKITAITFIGGFILLLALSFTSLGDAPESRDDYVPTVQAEEYYHEDEKEHIYEEKELSQREVVEKWLESYRVSGGMFTARVSMFTPYNNSHIVRIVLESTFSAGLRTQNEKERAMINLAVALAEEGFDISTINITIQENNSSTNGNLFNSAFSQFNRVESEPLRVTQEYMKFVDFETGEYIDWISNN